METYRNRGNLQALPFTQSVGGDQNVDLIVERHRQKLQPVSPRISSRSSKHRQAVGNEVLDTVPSWLKRWTSRRPWEQPTPVGPTPIQTAAVRPRSRKPTVKFEQGIRPIPARDKGFRANACATDASARDTNLCPLDRGFFESKRGRFSAAQLRGSHCPASIRGMMSRSGRRLSMAVLA